MKYFLFTFRISLMGWLQGRKAKLLAFLAVILTALVILIPSSRETEYVWVGVVLPQRGGQELAALLQEREGPVRFERSDADTAKRNVLAGNWDCALVLAEDFDTRLASLDVDGILTIQVSSASTVYPLVQESVCACMMELMAPHIAREYMEKVGAAAALPDAHRESDRVEIKLQTLDGKPLLLQENSSSELQHLLRCCVALLNMLWGLYLAVDLGQWREKSGVRRLESVRAPTAVILPHFLGRMLPVFAWGMALTVFLDGGVASAAGYFGFFAVVVSMSLFVSLHRPLWQAVPVLTPFLLPAALLLEPVLLDTALLFPALAPWIGWLPLTLLIRAASGRIGAFVGLLAEAAMFAALSMLPKKGKK